MVTLYNVVDTRFGMYCSRVVVKASKAKYFIPEDEWEE